MLEREIIIEALEYMLMMDLDCYDLNVEGTHFDCFLMIKEGNELIIWLRYDGREAIGYIEDYQTRDLKELYNLIGQIWCYNTEEVVDV